jgi:hypothetical protein
MAVTIVDDGVLTFAMNRQMCVRTLSRVCRTKGVSVRLGAVSASRTAIRSSPTPCYVRCS